MSRAPKRTEKILIVDDQAPLRDYVRVTAFVLPADPDAESTIVAGYATRLDANPDDVPALTGLGFAHWPVA